MKHLSVRTLLQRVTALLLAAVLVLPLSARAAAPQPILQTTQTFLDGLSYIHTLSTITGGQVESFSVELPRSSRVEPILLQSSGTVYGGASVSKAVELAESMGYNVYAAINTDYFSTTTGIPLGIVIEDGVYKSDAAGAPAMLIDGDNVTLCPDPQIALTLTNHTTAETITPNHFNKLRVATGGIYLLNADFSTVSTRTSTPGWFVRLKQVSFTPQPLGVNTSLQLQVTEVIRTSEALTIGADEYILTADDKANLSAVFESFRVGDFVTLNTRCDDPALARTRWAGGTGDTLVWNGALTDRSQWLHPDNSRAPRSALGVRADGSLVLYTADGRRSGSAGLTLEELAEELLAMDCLWAVNLDGGGSTVLSVRTPGQTAPSIRNTPSDGKPRACATYLLLVSREAGNGRPHGLALSEGELFVLAGSSIALPEVVVTDNVLDPVGTDVGSIQFSAQLGSVHDGVYTAGMNAGTDTLTLRANRYGIGGTAEIHVVNTLSELNVHADDSSANLASLSVNPGDTVQLHVTGSYMGREALRGNTGVTFALSEGLGSVDASGLLTISPTASGEGTLTVSAGGITKNITVKLMNVHLDVLSDHWAFNSVDFCYRNGIVSGISSTEFGPDRLIRRGDFILMLYSALGRPAVNAPCTFVDVAPTDYFYAAMAWAQATGLMGGVGDGRCLPLDPITREQAFTVLRKALPLLGKDCPDASTAVLNRFSDAHLIADYARSHTATLAAQGIVGGDGGKINPQGNLTRAQMATLVHRVMTHTPITEYPAVDIPADNEPAGDNGSTVAPPEGADLTLDVTELTVWSGESFRLTAGGVGDAEVTWSSSDPTVAAVAPDGTVTNLYTGMGTQTVVITASCGALTASCTVYCPQAGLVAIIYNVENGLNIRSAPDRSSTVQGMLSAGDVVVVLDSTDSWYRILYHDAGQARTGYVSADYAILNMR